ncbi:conserved protein of unknown function [Ectopseudomonas oleovorans]|uniref:Uncharacterized protein n=1 Tax=Ectopseudomonas oleovorans TaxID=301 RepID=A0A653AXK3_ECTOL|nr:conserved protein of unknown function [Pseudomonas oleovorans]
MLFTETLERHYHVHIRESQLHCLCLTIL